MGRGQGAITFGALPKVDVVAKLAAPAVHVRRLRRERIRTGNERGALGAYKHSGSARAADAGARADTHRHVRRTGQTDGAHRAVLTGFVGSCEYGHCARPNACSSVHPADPTHKAAVDTEGVYRGVAVAGSPPGKGGALVQSQDGARTHTARQRLAPASPRARTQRSRRAGTYVDAVAARGRASLHEKLAQPIQGHLLLRRLSVLPGILLSGVLRFGEAEVIVLAVSVWPGMRAALVAEPRLPALPLLLLIHFLAHPPAAMDVFFFAASTLKKT